MWVESSMVSTGLHPPQISVPLMSGTALAMLRALCEPPLCSQTTSMCTGPFTSDCFLSYTSCENIQVTWKMIYQLILDNLLPVSMYVLVL